MNDFNFSTSIVIYNNDLITLNNLVLTISKCPYLTNIILIDNSPINIYASLSNISEKVIYIKNNKNLGFGKSHNLAFKMINFNTKYHIVLNPDIIIDNISIFNNIFEYLEQNINVGLLVPKILNLDKTTYQQTKLLPTPFNLFASRFFPKFLNNILNRSYILDVYNKNNICNIPNLSGAFLVLRVNTLKQVGFFDNRYFLYLEDVDLVRRFHSISKTIYFPHASVFHIHAKMSFKFNKSFLFHILSTIQYFNKWGWFIDKDRVNVNKITLRNLDL